jgi:hypothetical protein
MKTKVIHILCEGPTEQGFVNEVLRPYLIENGVTSVKSVIVSTNKKLNAQGGMSSYTHARTDLNLMRLSNPDNDFVTHIFTTMFDLYALPNDFPGYDKAKAIVEPYACVNALEQSLSNAICDTRFIPYIQLHEFEALLFCGIEHIAKLYPKCKSHCEQLSKDLQKVGNPELIDNGPTTAPSKRIIKAIEGNGKYKYNKPTTGKSVTKEIGIDELRAKCPHFNEWIDRLLEK